MERTKAVSLLSGGLDSTVLAYMLHERHDLTLLSIDYGQRHSKEMSYASRTAATLGVPYSVIPIAGLGRYLSGSALSDMNVPVPQGHYAQENMKLTVVPNRNAIMLSIATGIAISIGAEFVAFAPHAGDHPIYPDCRPEFVATFNKMIGVANEGFLPPGFKIEAPFVGMSKAEIVELGDDLSVPFQHTWSCYEGGVNHCGRCGTCVERAEAFDIAGVDDPTRYDHPDYWKEVVRG
jgi:7-cyano-7-deazaguanine synthase